jgi:natural product precursor
MKKKIKKLSINKTTISNLDAAEMHGKMGGANVTTGLGTWFRCHTRYTYRLRCCI